MLGPQAFMNRRQNDAVWGTRGTQKYSFFNFHFFFERYWGARLVLPVAVSIKFIFWARHPYLVALYNVILH